MDTDRADLASGLQSVSIAVLAKAPVPGLAKTRLIPVLGAEGAARLQRQLTRGAVCTALDAGLGPVTLWCTPHAQHRFFRALQQTTSVTLLVQTSGDLGARMHQAFRLHCVQGPTLLIGTDCPAMTSTQLREAARALLTDSDVVLQPAEDGGYVLIGLRRPQPELFGDMTWSTPQVFAETKRRARLSGLRVRELETLWDVDVPADLARYRHLAPALNASDTGL